MLSFKFGVVSVGAFDFVGVDHGIQDGGQVDHPTADARFISAIETSPHSSAALAEPAIAIPAKTAEMKAILCVMGNILASACDGTA